MLQKFGRVGSAIALVALMAVNAVADPGIGGQNDAGTYADAGDVRVNATAVSLATLYGGSFRPNDIDWYASSVGGSMATCVVATVHANGPTYFALGAESGSGTTTAPALVSAGSTGTAGIAGMAPFAATLRLAPAPGATNFQQYDFRLDRVGIPSVNGDGPTAGDAGDSPATAMAAAPGCTGGHLTALDGVDMKDVYAIPVSAGDVVTYSLASNLNGISLTLLDVLGNVVGPSVVPGQSVSVSTAAPGTYYLSAARTTAVGDVGYVVGAIAGPEPTGCKPYCLDA